MEAQGHPHGSRRQGREWIGGQLHGDDTVARFQVAESGIQCNDTEVGLTGETYAGELFTGSDTIDATQCEEGGCHAY